MSQIVCSEVVDLQARMFAHRLKLGAVLKRAKIHRSSWHRWSHGGDVRNSSLSAIRGAIDEMIAERHQGKPPVYVPTTEPEQVAPVVPPAGATGQ